MISFFVVAIVIVCSVSAEQKCTGNPRKLNGKSCASTRHYHDGRKGACGCGPANGDGQFDWNRNGYVVAASQMYFDSGHKTWCGQHCGECIKLTTTGGFIPGQGRAPPAGQSVTFMITNVCPNNYPFQDWCNQQSQYGGENRYGYEVHFDLENGVNQITNGLGWENPEVTWEVTNCDEAHRLNQEVPSYTHWGQCQCATDGRRSVNDTTF